MNKWVPMEPTAVVVVVVFIIAAVVLCGGRGGVFDVIGILFAVMLFVF